MVKLVDTRDLKSLGSEVKGFEPAALGLIMATLYSLFYVLNSYQEHCYVEESYSRIPFSHNALLTDNSPRCDDQ